MAPKWGGRAAPESATEPPVRAAVLRPLAVAAGLVVAGCAQVPSAIPPRAAPAGSAGVTADAEPLACEVSRASSAPAGAGLGRDAREPGAGLGRDAREPGAGLGRDAREPDAQRWCGWGRALGQMQRRVELQLLEARDELGPFEQGDGAWSEAPREEVEVASPTPAVALPSPAATQPAAGRIARLSHERLVVTVARLWLDRAAGCLLPVGTHGTPRCGPQAWAAALQAGESLPALLEQVDRHVVELRERVRAATLSLPDGTTAELIDGLLSDLTGQRESGPRKPTSEVAMGGKRRGSGKQGSLAREKAKEGARDDTKALDLEGAEEDLDGDVDGRPVLAGPCAPGDPLCGWGGDGSPLERLFAEEARAAAQPTLPPPRPSGSGAGAVHGAAVEPSVAVLDGVMPLVRAHLAEIGTCLPDPSASELAVRLDVRARVAPDGSIRDVRVGPVSELPPAAASCVVGVLQQLRVPEPTDGGSHVVSFPLWVAGAG